MQRCVCEHNSCGHCAALLISNHDCLKFLWRIHLFEHRLSGEHQHVTDVYDLCMAMSTLAFRGGHFSFYCHSFLTCLVL